MPGADSSLTTLSGGRRRSTRSKRGESTRAKLRRKTTELVDSASQLITGKRKSRRRNQQADTNGDEQEEVAADRNQEDQEDHDEEDDEGASEQPGQERHEEEEGQQEDEAENSQPEGTPAKARRRSSRISSQPSRSPLRALTNMLPSAVTSRLAAVRESGRRANRARDGNDARQQHETDTSEAADEGKAPPATISLFDWRWLLPGLLVALLASLALLQLFHPQLLPWTSSSPSHSFSSSVLPLQEADWHRISHSFLPIKDWHSFKHRWEKWIEDDKRRSEEIVTAVKEWVDARMHKVEQHPSSAEAAADVSELRSEMSEKLSESRAGWLQEVADLIEQRVTIVLGHEAKARHADVQRVTAELRAEMEQRLADELKRGTDELLDTVRNELQHRLAEQSGDSGPRDAEWQSRLKDEVAAVERRAVNAALAVVDKRFVSSEQLQAVDADIRRYIQTTLSAQAGQYATAEELKEVENKVMTAVQQMTDKQQQQIGEKRLTADDKQQLIEEVMQAMEEEWAAEKQKMKDELRGTLLKEAGSAAEKEQSGTIDQLKQQLAELEQRLTSGHSADGPVDSSTRQWVEERLQSTLKSVHSDDSTQRDVARKLSEIEAALDKLKVDTQSTTPPSSSTSAPATSDIASALEHFAADRTNRVDYALASSGGRVVAHSPTHRAALSSSSVASKLLAWFTSPHLPEVPADALLDADMSVGHCWPMQSRQGSVIIGLRERVHISGISLQHASINVLPDGGASMPRRVRLSGVEDEQLDEARRQVTQGGEEELIGSVLGQFEYERDGSQVQQWTVGKGKGQHGRGYQYVRLDVLSNYGNNNYTCIYRVRVHGEPVKGE